jgi:hypothetical protein
MMPSHNTKVGLHLQQQHACSMAAQKYDDLLHNAVFKQF